MFVQTPYKAYLDSYKHITVITTEEVYDLKLDINGELQVLEFKKTSNGYQANLDMQLNLQQELYIHINNRFKLIVEIGMITTTKEFDQNNDSSLELGAIYSKAETTFRVWSPVATEMILKLGSNSYQMIGDGIHYTVKVAEDCELMEYYYIAKVNGEYKTVIDPYAYNLTANTESGVVVDLQKLTSSLNFTENDKSKMVIYEASVCDFTSDVDSDFKYKGKFKSFTENNHKVSTFPIGIDHVKELGATHIQLMPIYDFGSVDEQLVADNNYNWGYDPVHYNVPEGSYATGFDRYTRLFECQEMIKSIKDNGFGVIMDVVYNHVYDHQSFNYNKLVPNYYFRFKEDGELSDGSFCGNEVASERKMVRRYIIDTLSTWVKYYRIDGIRIDLMGLMDIETILEIEKQMKRINPNFIIYGEGWNMESCLDSDKRAAQINANKMENVGHFNDDFRNFIKGDNSDFSKHGYVQGNRNQEDFATVMSGKALDNEKTYLNPMQLINYVSCHDDHTLYDYLKINSEDEELITKQIIESYEHIFNSQGIPFIHSGCEMRRTKNGEKNTYNKSRQLNAIKWNSITLNQDIIEIIKDLIRRR